MCKVQGAGAPTGGLSHTTESHGRRQSMRGLVQARPALRRAPARPPARQRPARALDWHGVWRVVYVQYRVGWHTAMTSTPSASVQSPMQSPSPRRCARMKGPACFAAGDQDRVSLPLICPKPWSWHQPGDLMSAHWALAGSVCERIMNM